MATINTPIIKQGNSPTQQISHSSSTNIHRLHNWVFLTEAGKTANTEFVSFDNVTIKITDDGTNRFLTVYLAGHNLIKDSIFNLTSVNTTTNSTYFNNNPTFTVTTVVNTAIVQVNLGNVLLNLGNFTASINYTRPVSYTLADIGKRCRVVENNTFYDLVSFDVSNAPVWVNAHGASTLQSEGDLIATALAKTTPVDTDQIGLMDSSASNVLKKLSWANIKANLKSHFDSVYSSVSSKSKLPIPAFGKNWQNITSNVFGTSINIEIVGSCCSKDGLIMYVLAKDMYIGVQKSIDGGGTWVNVSPSITTEFTNIYCSSDGQIVYILYKIALNIWGFKKSNDGGITWSNAPFIVRNSPLAVFSNSMDVCYYCYGEQLRKYTVATGTETTVLTIALGTSFSNISVSGDGLVVFSTYQQQCYLSKDGGATFPSLDTTNIFANTSDFIQASTISYNGNVIILATAYNAIRVSTDTGTSWAAKTNTSSFGYFNTLCISDNGNVYYKTGYDQPTNTTVIEIGFPHTPYLVDTSHSFTPYVPFISSSMSSDGSVALFASAYSVWVCNSNLYSFKTINGNSLLGSGDITIGLTTNNNNTLVGVDAGANITTGSNNVCLGKLSATESTFINLTTESNYVVLGNNSTTNARTKVAWTVGSDERDKTNISYIDTGLSFINNLKPVQFKYRLNRDTEETSPESRLRYGFLAQDILPLEDTSVIVDDTTPEVLGVNETMLIPILVNAIKELTARIELLEAKLK